LKGNDNEQGIDGRNGADGPGAVSGQQPEDVTGNNPHGRQADGHSRSCLSRRAGQGRRMPPVDGIRRPWQVPRRLGQQRLHPGGCFHQGAPGQRRTRIRHRPIHVRGRGARRHSPGVGQGETGRGTGASRHGRGRRMAHARFPQPVLRGREYRGRDLLHIRERGHAGSRSQSQETSPNRRRQRLRQKRINLSH